MEESAERICLRDGHGRIHGPFDLVAGTDGSRSQIRALLNPSERKRSYEHGALWGTGRLPNPSKALLQIARGTRCLAGLLPTGEERCTFFWGLKQDELEGLKGRGFAAFRENVLEMFPAAEPVFSEFRGFEDLTFAGYLHALPRFIHSNRAVLLGDAAHSMSPHLGQGANLALLDAECLARQLAGKPSAEALVAYAAERRSQSRYFALLSRWLSPFFQSESRLLGLARDAALPVMCAFPWIRRQMEWSLAGYKTGFFDGLFAQPGTRAGLFPHGAEGGISPG
jgi:2-polyprenyl-6-methoxyphenol hydroxylase-like FAD-dependent oxidoreductase